MRRTRMASSASLRGKPVGRAPLARGKSKTPMRDPIEVAMILMTSLVFLALVIFQGPKPRNAQGSLSSNCSRQIRYA